MGRERKHHKPMSTTSTSTAGGSPTVEQVDPASLLVDRNVRVSVSLDKAFVDSVRELGVLVPVVAVRTAEGQLRVRFGHRRTAAAIEVDAATVPVVVVADEADNDEAEIARLVQQWTENEHRAPLSGGDKLNTIEQLSLLGVSAAQIAKRTKTARKQVDAALAVAGSELARAVACKYDFLDLLQASIVADFDGNPEVVKVLVKAARDGGFDHAAQQLRDERADTQRVQELTGQLTGEGVTVLARPDYASGAERLDRLGDSNGTPLDPEAHGSCPGHAAYIAHGWEYDDTDTATRTAKAVYVCTDPKGHGHQPRYAAISSPTRTLVSELSEAEREEARQERRTVIANNRAWASAETVRRSWIRTFLSRKTAPKNAPAFVAAALVHDSYEIRKGAEAGHRLARDLFGYPDPDSLHYGAGTAQLAALLGGATDGRAQVVALGVILAGYENCLNGQSWRNPSAANRRYFGFLAVQGYELSDVEQLAAAPADD
jgi:ParB family chromosome partitioning protein